MRSDPKMKLITDSLFKMPINHFLRGGPYLPSDSKTFLLAGSCVQLTITQQEEKCNPKMIAEANDKKQFPNLVWYTDKVYKYRMLFLS